ncbi:hypothetical protein GCM10023351_01060 [Microbacterium gilvum]|uniref:Uncharacterized protein n=1 Tax=Microbacterium gilvum TaxID=1336204 RepID=A0ABP8ZQG7_9MICO
MSYGKYKDQMLAAAPASTPLPMKAKSQRIALGRCRTALTIAGSAFSDSSYEIPFPSFVGFACSTGPASRRARTNSLAIPSNGSTAETAYRATTNVRMRRSLWSTTDTLGFDYASEVAA